MSPAPGSFVLDTSVAVAWYLPETFSAAAREWQERVLGGRIRLIVPRLHHWEIANVLRTYVRRGELAAELAHEIYAVRLAAPLELSEPQPASVLETALEYDATAYDAVYISLARSLQAPLITAERTTTPWVVRLGELVERVG